MASTPATCSSPACRTAAAANHEEYDYADYWAEDELDELDSVEPRAFIGAVMDPSDCPTNHVHSYVLPFRRPDGHDGHATAMADSGCQLNGVTSLSWVQSVGLEVEPCTDKIRALTVGAGGVSFIGTVTVPVIVHARYGVRLDHPGQTGERND